MRITLVEFLRYCRLQSTVFAAVFLVSGQALARETYVQFSARLVDAAEAAQLERADFALELFNLANSYRASKGVRALRANTENHGAAVAHAMDMMQNNYMGHIASTGQDFESRMRALRGGGMITLPRMAENAARVSKPGVVDKAMAQGLFQQWVKSAEHRHTLLSRDYVSVATGVVSQGGVLYADQIFVGPETKTNLGSSSEDGLY